VTNTARLVRFWGHRKLITICGKFVAVSHEIKQTDALNLEKFAAENCGPYILMYFTYVKVHLIINNWNYGCIEWCSFVLRWTNNFLFG